MSLLEQLLKTDGRVIPLPLPPATRIERVLRKLPDGRMASPPQSLDLDALARRVREAVVAGRAEAVAPRDWRFVAWSFWRPTMPLAAEPAVLTAYGHQIRSSRRRGWVRQLIAVWLQRYRPDRPGLHQIGTLLQEMVPQWSWPWRERQQLFDAKSAPFELAGRCLYHPTSLDVALDELGLGNMRHVGLPAAAFVAACQLLYRKLEKDGAAMASIERLTAWATWNGGLLAPGPLGDALLLPWITHQPEDEIKQFIQDFLLKHYGDPRLDPRHWQHVSEEAHKVFRRWLVKAALDQFLEVIDRLAAEHMWRYRRAFWSAYFRHDAITEADVMFGDTGYRMAKKLFGQNMPCARLKRGRRKLVENGHAVLLLRIGRLIIADWSHNGRCAIWRDTDPRAPKFGQRSYTSDDVDADAAWFEKSHVSPSSYSWQISVRDFIHQHTGIMVSDKDIMVD